MKLRFDHAFFKEHLIIRFKRLQWLLRGRRKMKTRRMPSNRQVQKTLATHITESWLETNAYIFLPFPSHLQIEFVFKGPLPPSPPDFRYNLAPRPEPV